MEAKINMVLVTGFLIVKSFAMPGSLGGEPLSFIKSLSTKGFEERSRAARQTMGYQPVESTDIVISSGGSQAYRGSPSPGTNRGQTVVVRVPNENYGRRYLANPIRETQMNHVGLPYLA